MNEAHLHLILNHVPILGSLFGLLLLLVAVFRRNESLIRAALVTLVVTALLTIPTQLTGEGAEEIVEHRPGVSHALIHEHEEAAELSFWVMEVTGVLALATLLLRVRSHARGSLLTYLILAGAVVSFGLLARAGNLGGQILHPESRPGFVPVAEEHD